jgi:gluconolactonase
VARRHGDQSVRGCLGGADAADRIDVIDGAGKRSAAIDLPAGSLPTNVCIGGPGLDELYVTAAHSQSLLRIRFDAGDPSPA